MFRQALTALAAAATLTAFALPAAAETTFETRSISVSYADLDLSSQRDASRMLVRLDRAAARACGADYHGRTTLEQRRDAQACQRETLERAVASLNSSQLASAFEARLTREG
ncbi:MAG: UrcA family protein [Caulobacterales bacterium]|jgi:UrcA family protein